MASLTEFFNKHEDDELKGITHKNSIIKRNIIAHMAINGECTLSELTKELHISVPTITKLVQELVDENIVTDLGKVETPGGRRPNIFGLANSAIYFAGVSVNRDKMSFLITDLQNNIIKEEYGSSCVQAASERASAASAKNLVFIISVILSVTNLRLLHHYLFLPNLI